ncbi:hypothetical protein [Streptomyces sp. NPDC005283]|uniref:hypothetical protein n=1 Tax=unclassified Streptomyces TaxID=2593676 RepID=UPI0034522241
MLRQRAIELEFIEPERSDDDRRQVRLYGWGRWSDIAVHYATDPDDALDLYGTRLCRYEVQRIAWT